MLYKVNRKKFLLLIIILIILLIIGIIIATFKNKSIFVKKDESKIVASNIVNNEEKYYGKIVNGYECTAKGVEEWMLFYANERNIYLIASNFIRFDSCPNSENQKITRNSDYALSMNNVIEDYTGSEDIRTLNSSYFNIKDNSISTKNNMKAVAYMLDTEVWKEYTGNKAEYAVGGPSLEIFLNSYNKKYKTTLQTKSDTDGYRISEDGGKSWDDSAFCQKGYNDRLYFPTSEVDYMWLASPSCWANSRILAVNSSRMITGIYFNSEPGGFRPIVCLKPNVSLKYQEEELYIVKD